MPAPPRLAWRVERDAQACGSRSTIAADGGRSSAVRLVDAQGATHEVARGLLGYALAGSTRRWPLRLDARAASFVRVQATVNAQPVEAQLTPPLTRGHEPATLPVPTTRHAHQAHAPRATHPARGRPRDRAGAACRRGTRGAGARAVRPAAARASGVLFLDVSLNGEPTHRIARVQQIDGRLYAASADLNDLGVATGERTHEPSNTLVALDTLRGCATTWTRAARRSTCACPTRCAFRTRSTRARSPPRRPPRPAAASC